jgi:hypothetical protein
VEPGCLCSNLLHKLPIRPSGGERPHVLEVARRQSTHVGKRLPQVGGQAVNDLGTPTLFVLPLQDDLPDVPAHQSHRRIGDKYGMQTGLLDAFLDLREDGEVVRFGHKSLGIPGSCGSGTRFAAWGRGRKDRSQSAARQTGCLCHTSCL